MQSVNIAHSYLQSVSNLFHFIILKACLCSSTHDCQFVQCVGFCSARVFNILLTNELDGYASILLVGIGISAWQFGHVRVL